MSIVLSNKILTYLVNSIGTTDTQIVIGTQDYTQIFSAGLGDVYALLRSTTAREIIKIDLNNSVSGSYLTVARGQGGSIAAAWPVGTKLLGSTNADHYNSILQAGGCRTIDYNPNEVLTPLHAGEKVYQNLPAGFERWWKSFNSVNPYWDIITGAPGAGEDYTDIGWDYDLLISSLSEVELVGLTSDGWVRQTQFAWSAARDAASGIASDNSGDWALICAYLQTQFSIFRGFYFFDLSGLGWSVIESAKLSIYRRGITGGPVTLCMQQSAELPPIVLGHFNAGTGFISNDTPDVQLGGYYDFNFNASGLTFIQNTINSVPGAILCLVIKEYTHDYLNVTPTGINFVEMYTADYFSTGVKPKLLVKGGG